MILLISLGVCVEFSRGPFIVMFCFFVFHFNCRYSSLVLKYVFRAGRTRYDQMSSRCLLCLLFTNVSLVAVYFVSFVCGQSLYISRRCNTDNGCCECLYTDRTVYCYCCVKCTHSVLKKKRRLRVVSMILTLSILVLQVCNLPARACCIRVFQLQLYQ